MPWLQRKKNPSPLQSPISVPWYRGSDNAKCRVVCYDIRYLKPPGPGKIWISPTPSHVSLKFLSWQSGMSWLILGQLQQGLELDVNNIESSHLSLTDVVVTFIMITIYFLCVHLIQRRSCDNCLLVSKTDLDMKCTWKGKWWKVRTHY